eukprot:m.238456 g.238456  ORF g.238456 m.238456 type:complete len:381 (-) comp13303_c0_seq1:66-1208(-)
MSGEAPAAHAHAPYVDDAGTLMEWSDEHQAFFPKIDESLIEQYQASYESTAPPPADDEWERQETPDGKPYFFNKKTGKTQWNDPHKHPEEKKKKDKDLSKPKEHKDEKKFFQLSDDKNPNVYVTGLPQDTTDEEFEELMSKYGIIAEDADGEKKVKLYRTPEGELKGDARCCYLKVASVALALQLLDGYELRGQTLHASRAVFQYKEDGHAPPRVGKKKKSAAQSKLLSWKEGPTVRPKVASVVVIKHMFDPKEFEEDPTYLTELSEDVRTECSKFGQVKKVLIFDRHPEGVLSVRFSSKDEADSCIAVMNGRWFAKRKLEAEHWDGTTNYSIEETDLERQERLKKWDQFLDAGDDEPKEKEQPERPIKRARADDDADDD